MAEGPTAQDCHRRPVPAQRPVLTAASTALAQRRQKMTAPVAILVARPLLPVPRSYVLMALLTLWTVCRRGLYAGVQVKPGDGRATLLLPTFHPVHSLLNLSALVDWRGRTGQFSNLTPPPFWGPAPPTACTAIGPTKIIYQTIAPRARVLASQVTLAIISSSCSHIQLRIHLLSPFGGALFMQDLLSMYSVYHGDTCEI